MGNGSYLLLPLYKTHKQIKFVPVGKTKTKERLFCVSLLTVSSLHCEGLFAVLNKGMKGRGVFVMFNWSLIFFFFPTIFDLNEHQMSQ